jgi:hypothetical protein
MFGGAFMYHAWRDFLAHSFLFFHWLDREPEEVVAREDSTNSHHAAAYSGSYNGLTGPTQAMSLLGVAIASGLVASSPDFAALDLTSLDFSSLDLGVDFSNMIPPFTLSAATHIMDLAKLNLPDLATMDWSVFGVSDVAKEYHLENLASWPSVDAKSIVESWALQHKEAVSSHLDSTLQAFPSVDDFAKAFDTTELVQTVQSKVTDFQTAFQGRVEAIDLDLSSRASVVEAAYKDQMAQWETHKELVLQQEKIWTEQLAQVPTKFLQWTASIKSQVQTLLTEAMPQYGRDIAGQFQAVLPKELPEIKMPPMNEIQFRELPELKFTLPQFQELKMTMPHMKEFEFSLPEISLPQVQELKIPEMSLPQVKEISIPGISLPQIKEVVAAPIQAVTPHAPVMETLSKPTFVHQPDGILADKPAFVTSRVVESYQSQVDRMTESLLLSK